MKGLIMLTIIFTFLGSGPTASKDKDENRIIQTNNKEQYVSMDCQKGDITLTLDTNNTFDLTILFWDNKTLKHTGQESIKGKWLKSEKLLTLSTDDNIIKYEVKTSHLKIGNKELNCPTYGFKSNSKDFFATSFDLLEKEQTDKFLNNAVK